MINVKVKYWLELSEYDLETANAMLVSKRFLYVGFMCHQTIEKIIKAYFNSKYDEAAPYTHNLSYLARKASLYDELTDEFKNTINLLEPLNIEARYPSYKAQLMSSLT